MNEAIKSDNALLSISDVLLDKGIKLSDLTIFSGDVCWMEVEHELYSEIFVSFLLGLLQSKQGRMVLAGKEKGYDIKKFFSYLSAGYWLPNVDNIEMLVKIFANSLSLKVSLLLDEIRKNIEGMGAAYAFKMKIQDMKPWTKRRVVTAISLAIPSLLVLLIEPYQGLDTEAANFLQSKINDLKTEGSSFILFCSEEPLGYSMHSKFRGKI